MWHQEKETLLFLKFKSFQSALTHTTFLFWSSKQPSERVQAQIIVPVLQMKKSGESKDSWRV